MIRKYLRAAKRRLWRLASRIKNFISFYIDHIRKRKKNTQKYIFQLYAAGVPVDYFRQRGHLSKKVIGKAIEEGKHLYATDESLRAAMNQWEIGQNDKVVSIYSHVYSVNDDKILKLAKNEEILKKEIEIANAIRAGLAEYEVPFYEKIVTVRSYAPIRSL